MMMIEELKEARQAACRIKEGYADTEGERKIADLWCTLIDAEIERQSVGDRYIQDSIGYLSTFKIFGKPAKDMRNLGGTAFRLAIDALRAYRKPEPCVWCAEKNEIRPIEHIDYYMEDEYGRMRRLMFRHCPNCGQKLDWSEE